MIPVVIRASVFENNENIYLQRVMEMIQTMPSSTTGMLVEQNLPKENNSLTTESLPFCRVNLSDWIDSTHQAMKVVIRNQAGKLSDDQIVLLNAQHHNHQDISNVLHEAAKIWFYLKSWQPAFVLIVDDYLASRLVRELSESFYIQPSSTSQPIIHAEIRKMRRQIMSYRWLGLGRVSRLVRFMSIFLQKLKHYAYRKIS